jgi:protein SERAC1
MTPRQARLSKPAFLSMLSILKTSLANSHSLQPSIIFVHGLSGDREETWKSEDAAAPWPQTLLPSKVPNARVLTFGYDAYVADWRGMVSKNRIGNHAMNLLTSVATFREEDETVGFVHLKC